ncbi:Eukaryotic translation initiation factor 2-alpha kinase [Cytospora mali]|uniref:Eukaryotic translation initiation factor 2-alpha kinase n=1 Tax=Cytospora mali TaxID=578113 RepID=A0A194W204_CYTMA|nr:Eukaryotic translation initiation factor 2-alpha kinase [Valsa mali]
MYADLKRWVAKVIDLGGSEAVHRYTLRTGTYGFVAPEALMHKPCNEKIDMFSLGIIGVFLFTYFDMRKMGWPKDVKANTQARWMREKVIPLLDRVEPEFKPLLGGPLALKPENRWSTPKLLNFLWRLRDAPGPASPMHRVTTSSSPSPFS